MRVAVDVGRIGASPGARQKASGCAGSNTPQAIAAFGTSGQYRRNAGAGVETTLCPATPSAPLACRPATRSEDSTIFGIRVLRRDQARCGCLARRGAHTGPAENPFGDEQFGVS